MTEPQTRAGRRLVDDWKHQRFTNPTEDILAIEAEAASLAPTPPDAPDVPDAAKVKSQDPDSTLAWALTMVGAFTVKDDSGEVCIMALGAVNDVARRMDNWLSHHPEMAANLAPTPPDALRAAAHDLYSIAVGEHGHDETHSADWPSCLPAHIAMNRYRAALAATEGE